MEPRRTRRIHIILRPGAVVLGARKEKFPIRAIRTMERTGGVSHGKWALSEKYLRRHWDWDTAKKKLKWTSTSTFGVKKKKFCYPFVIFGFGLKSEPLCRFCYLDSTDGWCALLASAISHRPSPVLVRWEHSQCTSRLPSYLLRDQS